MSSAVFHVGDVLTVLPTLPACSVDLAICSPPFLALRSYLPADHPDKALEHGSEPTVAGYLAQLLDVTELVGRVLTPHGSICVELGDTYSGTGGGGQRRNGRPLQSGEGLFAPGRRDIHNDNWPDEKSLCLVPSLYAASLAYGRNILALPGTLEWREFRPWRVRNLIAWVRPNPPVGALGDKFRPATSYITVATRAADRWWDDLPTRQPVKHPDVKFDRTNEGRRTAESVPTGWDRLGSYDATNSAGAPLLDWWEITTSGFTSRLGQHFATFPAGVVVPLIESMCPRRVCRTCGKPSRRKTEHSEEYREARAAVVAGQSRTSRDVALDSRMGSGAGPGRAIASGQVDVAAHTVGWTTCGCPGTEQTRLDGFHDGAGWRAGVVLDPYAGTGTTLLVATGHGREAIGVDLNPVNATLAEERLGLFLTVAGPVSSPAV